MSIDAQLPLREAYEAFCAKNRAQFAEREVSPAAATFFRCHDTAHVVFGCDTSLFGEGVVKLYTIFGTTLGFRRHLAGYAEADAFGLFRQYSARHLSRQIGGLLMAMPATIRRARRMHRPWPWAEHDEWLDVPLTEIRREFGIELTQRPPPASRDAPQRERHADPAPVVQAGARGHEPTEGHR